MPQNPKVKSLSIAAGNAVVVTRGERKWTEKVFLEVLSNIIAVEWPSLPRAVI
jgi:hypothetical protein